MPVEWHFYSIVVLWGVIFRKDIPAVSRSTKLKTEKTGSVPAELTTNSVYSSLWTPLTFVMSRTLKVLEIAGQCNGSVMYAYLDCDVCYQLPFDR